MTTSVIVVPKLLVAERDTHRKAIQNAVRSAQNALQRPDTRVRFDFSKTEKLFPGGMLLLLAHLELLLQQFPGRVSARCPPHSIAAQLLAHFGIADRLGISPAASKPSHESVVNWKYETGTQADGSAISSMIDEYRKIAQADIPDGLYDVLTEALTNVRHHAYPTSDLTPQTLRRWWLFSRYVEPENDRPGNLFIAVYDVGVGIQNSMRAKLLAGEVILETTDDLFGWAGWTGSKKRLERLLLQRAIEHKRSSTGKAFRGNGLPEMKEFVLQTTTGRLYIISGQAQYTCMASNQTSACSSCDDPTAGTLILWSIPLQYREQQR